MDATTLMQELETAWKCGKGTTDLKYSLDDIHDICIIAFQIHYGMYTMDVVKLIEEMSELNVALIALKNSIEQDPAWNATHLSWKHSLQATNVIEEMVDVEIMLFIVNKVYNVHYMKNMKNAELCAHEIPCDTPRASWFDVTRFVSEFSINIQTLAKGFRTQFNPDTSDAGWYDIKESIDRVYSLITAMKKQYNISETDFDTMRYVKYTRLLKRYGYSCEEG